MYCVYEIISYITHELFSYIFFLNTEILIWSEWCGCLIKDLNNQKMSSIWQISSARIQGGRRRVEAENAIVVIRERHWQLLHQHDNVISEKVTRWLLRSRLYSKKITSSWSASLWLPSLFLSSMQGIAWTRNSSIAPSLWLLLSLPSTLFLVQYLFLQANSFFFPPLSIPAKLSATRTHKSFYKIAQ